MSEQSQAAGPDEAPQKTRFFARFSAGILHALEPIIRGNQETFYVRIRGLIIEPCPLGGVILAAFNPAYGAIVRDPRGYASKAARVLVSDGMFLSVKPCDPIIFHYAGETDEIMPPEWMQPSEIVLTKFGCAVTPKMPHPRDKIEDSHMLYEETAESGNVHSGYYRVEDERPDVNWRGILRNVSKKSCFSRFDPRLMGRFSRLIDFATCDNSESRGVFATGDDEGPICLRVDGNDNLILLQMPFRDTPNPGPLPEWTDLDNRAAENYKKRASSGDSMSDNHNAPDATPPADLPPPPAPAEPPRGGPEDDDIPAPAGDAPSRDDDAAASIASASAGESPAADPLSGGGLSPMQEI